MALWDEVTTRYAAQELIELTRSGRDNTATTVDTTVGNAAATDIQAYFEILAGVVYDGTDARHVMVAVEGVVTLLRMRQKNAQTAHKNYFEKWKDDLRDLGKVTGRNRVVPKSTSLYTVTDEVPSGLEVDMPFGTRRMDDIIPAAPRQGAGLDD